MRTPSMRAAGIALRAGDVLLHRRKGETVWALPGGRVELGESATETLAREFQEELACTVVCGELAFVAENIFQHAGVQMHEVGLYFPVLLAATSAVVLAPVVVPSVEEGLEFRWFSRASLSSINLRPAFLVSALAVKRLEFQHVVVRQQPGI